MAAAAAGDVVDEDGGRRRRLQWEAERARCVAAEVLRIENFVVRHCLPSALRDAERCCENDATALAPGVCVVCPYFDDTDEAPFAAGQSNYMRDRGRKWPLLPPGSAYRPAAGWVSQT